eukprot:482455-Amphidinium_carterae.1
MTGTANPPPTHALDISQVTGTPRQNGEKYCNAALRLIEAGSLKTSYEIVPELFLKMTFSLKVMMRL